MIRQDNNLEVHESHGVGLYAEIVQVLRDDQGPMVIPADWRTKLESMRVNAAER
jgi:hypothetical protein